MLRYCARNIIRFNGNSLIKTQRCISVTCKYQVRSRSRRSERDYQIYLSQDDTGHERRNNIKRVTPEKPRATDDVSQLEERDRYYIPSHIKYETLPQSDSRFGQMVMLAQNRKLRERKQVFLLEGSKYIEQAVDAGIKINLLFFTKGEQLQGLPLDEMVADGTQLYKVKMGHMQLWTSLVTASGVMAVCKMPKQGEAVSFMEKPLPLTLVCDNIRDPGNLGMLLRSAAAVNCQLVLLTKGCVDLWEPKVLRAASGAHYYLNVLSHVGWELLTNYLPPDCQIYLTDGCRHTDDPDVLDRRTKKILSNYEQNEFEEVVETPRGSLFLDPTFKDDGLLETFAKVSPPVVDYFAPDFTRSHAVIIAGSDTQGVTPEAKKLAYEKHGMLLSVPMATAVRGLNAAVGGSVVLFEVLKQHLQEKRAT